MHGITKDYYESGALERETPHENGEKHGIERGYEIDTPNIAHLTLYNRNRKVLSLYKNLIYKDINHDSR